MTRSYRNTPPITLLRNLVRAHESVTRRAAARLDRHGLHPSEFDVVMALGNTEGKRMCDLAASMLTSAPNVTRLVKTLEEKGLVERQRNPESDREVVARLTKQGEALFEQAYPAAYRFWKGTFEDVFSAAEIETLNLLLGRLAGLEDREGV